MEGTDCKLSGFDITEIQAIGFWHYGNSGPVGENAPCVVARKKRSSYLACGQLKLTLVA